MWWNYPVSKMGLIVYTISIYIHKNLWHPENPENTSVENFYNKSMFRIVPRLWSLANLERLCCCCVFRLYSIQFIFLNNCVCVTEAVESNCCWNLILHLVYTLHQTIPTRINCRKKLANHNTIFGFMARMLLIAR